MTDKEKKIIDDMIDDYENDLDAMEGKIAELEETIDCYLAEIHRLQNLMKMQSLEHKRALADKDILIDEERFRLKKDAVYRSKAIRTLNDLSEDNFVIDKDDILKKMASALDCIRATNAISGKAIYYENRSK